MNSNINITVYNSKVAQDAAERAELAAKKTENATDNLIDPTPPGTQATPAVIPNGPEGRKGKFEPEPGFYQGFAEVTEDRRWYFYWSGYAWTLKDMGALPMQPVSDEVVKGGADATSQDAVFTHVDLNTINPNEYNNYLVPRNQVNTNFSKYIKNIWLKGRKNQDINSERFRINYFSYKTYFASGISIQISVLNGSTWNVVSDFNFPIDSTNPWVEDKILVSKGASNSYQYLYIQLGIEPEGNIPLIEYNNLQIKKQANFFQPAIDTLKFDSGKYLTVGKGQMFPHVQAAIDFVDYDDVDNRVNIIVYPGVYPYFNTYKNKDRKRFMNFIALNKKECIIKDDSGQYLRSAGQMWFDGVCENLSFIATHTAEATPAEPSSGKSYGLHMDYGANNAVFRNCSFYSEQASAVGIGTFQDDYIEFDNCEMISNIPLEYFPYAYLPHYGGMFIHSAIGSNVTNQNIVMKNCYVKGSGDNAAFLTCVSEQWDFSPHIRGLFIGNTFANRDNQANLRMEFNLDVRSNSNNNTNLNMVASSPLS